MPIHTSTGWPLVSLSQNKRYSANFRPTLHNMAISSRSLLANTKNSSYKLSTAWTSWHPGFSMFVVAICCVPSELRKRSPSVRNLATMAINCGSLSTSIIGFLPKIRQIVDFSCIRSHVKNLSK